MLLLPSGYDERRRGDGTLGTPSERIVQHFSVLAVCGVMKDRQRLLVVADDKDVAEVAAFGLRMYEGWEPVIATSPAEAIEISHGLNVVGIAIIVVQPSSRVPRTIAKLLSLSQELSVPLFGITPDATVSEQFTLLGVKSYCTPFDPIHMWTHVPQSTGFAFGH